MVYKLALVVNDAIVGRLDAPIHAHSEATTVLTESKAGVGKKGETVRVPHPLEDPTAHDGDAARDVVLALVGEALDEDDKTVTTVLRVFGPQLLDAALASDVRRLDSAVVQMNQKLDLAIANLGEQLDAKADKTGE